ncbi:MAG: glycerol-3-phosphate 1-O-acyltransferase PlsY [Defluviitaleaceae bacterium]|nr:glycerol-3-phosphate 1-O-acyltransferase PlsY [Defluviitaleaceae bacterium]
MYRLIALLIGYAIGCIQTAYFIGKLHGIDIREHGSKNAGMTNVTRTIGKRAGAFVFAVDILKGVAAFIIPMIIFRNEAFIFCAHRGCVYISHIHQISSALPGMYGTFGAILGHCFPVMLKFRGGKGVSCFLLLPFLIDWRVGLVALVIGLIGFIPTRYISLGSLIYTFMAVVAMVLFGHQFEAIILMTVITVLIWFLHRENIKRLLSGTERKFLSKK